MKKMTFKRMRTYGEDDDKYLVIDEFVGDEFKPDVEYNSYKFVISYGSALRKEVKIGEECIYEIGRCNLESIPEDYFEKIDVCDYMRLSLALKRAGKIFNKKKGVMLFKHLTKISEMNDLNYISKNKRYEKPYSND